jgi:hypothetical protein
MTSQDRASQDRNRRVCDPGERPQLSGFESSAPERRLFDASLLFGCMARLQIDRGELANDDPLLFRELQGMCALCRSKDKCVEDLASEFDDAQWDRWWAYCPNSATLVQIGAVQNCSCAAQHLKMPRSAA